jgi:hypothetical protein
MPKTLFLPLLVTFALLLFPSLGEANKFGVLVGDRSVFAGTIPANPLALAVGPGGWIYVAQPDRVIVVSPDLKNSKIVVGGSGCGGRIEPTNPRQTQLNHPTCLEFGLDGTLFIADPNNELVISVSLQSAKVASVVHSEGCKAQVTRESQKVEDFKRPTALGFGGDSSLSHGVVIVTIKRAGSFR